MVSSAHPHLRNVSHEESDRPAPLPWSCPHRGGGAINHGHLPAYHATPWASPGSGSRTVGTNGGLIDGPAAPGRMLNVSTGYSRSQPATSVSRGPSGQECLPVSRLERAPELAPPSDSRRPWAQSSQGQTTPRTGLAGTSCPLALHILSCPARVRADRVPDPHLEAQVQQGAMRASGSRTLQMSYYIRAYIHLQRRDSVLERKLHALAVSCLRAPARKKRGRWVST